MSNSEETPAKPDNRKPATGNQHPPRWAQRFLEWYCRPELLEDLQGDLNEYFHRHCKKKGDRNARLLYIINVLKFFRSYTVRKPEFITLIIHWIMLSSYIKTSGRSIVRNKLFSTINIAGLAISMSVGLLMIAFLSDLLSYDKFHAKGDRIYRVNTIYQGSGGEQTSLASNSVKAGKKLRESLTGIQDMVMLRQGFGGDARFDETVVPLSGLWAEEYFFNVFSFPLLQGDSRTALKDPYSIVLTETSAKKIFGNSEALGKTIKFDTLNYTVTGILKDVPKFSHIQFESLVSFSTIDLQSQDDKNYLDWGNIWSNYIYIVLPKGGTTDGMQQNFDALSTEENAGLDHARVSLWLQPLYSIALGPDLSNPIGPTMMIAVVWVVAALAFIVILSACFNYTNLSIARSLRRSREVGIRKVIGALKSHVLGQFVSEAVLISLLALVLSFLLFLFFRPQFLSIAPELSNIVLLDLSPAVFMYFVLLAIVVGIVAGFLPALFFARIKAVNVLKDVSSVKVFKSVTMRKALIVVQYTFSLTFIAATMIGYKQYKHFLSFDLGFNTANVLNITLQGNKADLLIKEIEELPEVETISQSQMITSVGNYWGTLMKYNNPQDSSFVGHNTINENYLPMHAHKLLAGRNFAARTNGEQTEVIVNEMVLKRFDIAGQSPIKAVGEIVTIEGKKMEIIGVVKDFHYGKADSEIHPVVFFYSNAPGGFVNAMIVSTDWPATLSRLEHAWKKIDPVHPFRATFYDDQIEKSYSEYSAMIKIIGFLAFLAISISSMGLLGMVVFTTETRLREISIRKVLGASEGSLVYLMSKGFVFLLATAALVALPATYLFFDQVVLTNIAYHAPIGAFELFSGLILVVVIAGIMIGGQTLKVARSNPAEVLKTE